MKARYRLASGLLAVLLTLGLTGCWDSTDLSSEYVTALGIDYKDGKYILYGQMIDFSAVAKTEATKPAAPSVWIGRGTGKGIYEALEQLMATSQTALSTEQLEVVVVREPAMGKMSEILDALNRVRAARYTAWMFGTKQDMLDLFNSDRFFGRSQLASVMYNPKEQMRRSSYIEPVTMQSFVAAYNENPTTSILPSIHLTGKVWKQKKKKMNVEMLDGLFAFKVKQNYHYFTRNISSGLRWINPQLKRHVITVEGGPEQLAVVAVTRTRHKTKVSFAGGEPVFNMSFKLDGELDEMNGSMDSGEITSQVEKIVKEEIMKAYKAGAASGVDLFNLDETMFRHHYGQWKQLQAGEGWQPSPDDGQLQVEVTFRLKHSGTFKTT